MLEKGYEYALSKYKGDKPRTRDTRSVVQSDHIPDGAPHGILVPDETEHADPDSDPVRGIFHLSKTQSVAVWDSSPLWETLCFPYLYIKHGNTFADRDENVRLPGHIRDLLLSPDDRFRHAPEWILQMYQKLENSRIDGFKPCFAKQSKIASMGPNIFQQVENRKGETVTILDPDHSTTFPANFRGSPRYWTNRRLDNALRNNHWSKARPTATNIFSTRTLNPGWFEIKFFLRDKGCIWDYPVQVDDFFMRRDKLFKEYILFPEEGGIFEKDTPYVERIEWNRGFYTHLHEQFSHLYKYLLQASRKKVTHSSGISVFFPEIFCFCFCF